jgi:hypothetical protein
MSAPSLPTDRPPTRAEVWAHYHHIYFDFKGHRPNGICTPTCLRTDGNELEVEAAEMWAWRYVVALRNGWDKQPDWKEGDEVIPAGVPNNPYETFTVANSFKWADILKSYMATAERRAA